jgi:tetratricopeptide (TPR) repeat protein
VGEASTLHNIGTAYSNIKEFQKALVYLNQALLINQGVGNLEGEFLTLANIGAVYRATNQPLEAIANLEQAAKLTLKIRSSLSRDNRQQFVQADRGPTLALIGLLIDRGAPDRAYEWANLAATADLADYALKWPQKTGQVVKL